MPLVWPVTYIEFRLGVADKSVDIIRDGAYREDLSQLLRCPAHLTSTQPRVVADLSTRLGGCLRDSEKRRESLFVAEIPRSNRGDLVG